MDIENTPENKENRFFRPPSSSASKKSKITLPEQQGDLEEYMFLFFFIQFFF